jgi:hypothetical protein
MIFTSEVKEESMLVVLDANILIKDPILRNPKWSAAKDAIAADRLRIVLPEVARLEVIAGYHREHEEKVERIKSVLRKSTKRAKEAALPLLSVYSAEIEAYESILWSRIRDIGIDVAAPPDHDHLSITNRAVARQAPFDLTGGGYRDTLVWLTAIEQIDEPPFNDLTLASDDDIFTVRVADLAAELRVENDAELTVVRSLARIEFPDEYDSAPYDLTDIDNGIEDIEFLLKEALPGLDITPWSPPGPDYAEVRAVKRVHIDPETIQVKKRYEVDIYEVGLEAVADVEAKVLVIHGGAGQDGDFTQMSATWRLRLSWHGVTQGYRNKVEDAGSIEVISLDG